MKKHQLKQRAILLDERSDSALNRASRYLCMSRSEIVRRMALQLDAAVFWGVQNWLNSELSVEELREKALQGCAEWQLFTMTDWFNSLEGINAAREQLKVVATPKDTDAAFGKG